MDEKIIKLATQIASIRKQKNITQKQLAKLIASDQQHISKFENGKLNINLKTLLKICEVLNLNIEIVSNNK